MTAFCTPSPVNRITIKTGPPVSSTCNLSTRNQIHHAQRKRAQNSTARHVPQCVDITNSPSVTAPTVETFSADKSALREGIKAIAVGKKGVKPVPTQIMPHIFAELLLAEQQTFKMAAPNIHDLFLLRASFMGSLFVKADLSPSEMELLALCSNPRTKSHASGTSRVAYGYTCTSGEVLEYIAPGIENSLCSYARRALDGERFSISDARKLGELLYGVSEPRDQPVKVLIAHIMRVRHEDASELSGLAIAAAKSVNASFFSEIATTPSYERVLQVEADRYVHIAEPFDGVVTWDLLTPLLARHLREKHGMRVVMGVGKSSGPKTGPNLLDVVSQLGVALCSDGEEIMRESSSGEFGVAVSQGDVSRGLSEWVHIRRTIVKRPSIATTEKYVDVCPGGAALFIGSAFHAGYVERMAIVAENVGFPGYIIIGGGMEGSTGLGVSSRRKATLWVGWRTGNEYGRKVLSYDMAFEKGIDGKVLEFKESDMPKLRSLKLENNVDKIVRFSKEGTSGDMVFDERVFATCQAVDRALEVLHNELPTVFGA